MQSISIRKGLVFAISIILIISAFSITVSAIPSIEDHSPDTAGTGDNFIVNATVSDSVVLENFTTYKEMDSDDDFVVTKNKIAVTTLRRDADSYVVCDKGPNHFSGDFEHLGKFTIGDYDDSDWGGMCAFWALSNFEGNGNECGLSADEGIHMLQAFLFVWDGKVSVYLRKFDGGMLINSTWTTAIYDTSDTRWWQVMRVGKNVTMNFYTDAARTVLSETINITENTAHDYRYVYGAQNTCSTEHVGQWISCDLENLYLQGIIGEIDGVWVEYWFDGGSRTNESMTQVGTTDYYEKTINIPSGSTDDLWYNISANNTNGIWSSLNNQLVVVSDDDGPEINDVQAIPSSAFQGGYINITCTLTDNIEVDTVTVNITYPNSTYHNETMLGNYYYNTTYDQVGTYDYFIWANDTSGNGNTSLDYGFVIQQDSTPPASITNLQNITGDTWINWTWNNPPDLDFNYTIVYLNGTWMTNTSNPFYDATGLDQDASYEIGTHTVDLVGNINTTWVNQTSKTLFLPVHNIDTGLNYSTIQAAIDATETINGHTILVDSGTYTENVDVYKSLTIRSTSGNPLDTVVQANNSNDHVFEVTVDYVNISGFTVQDANASDMAGIYLSYADYCILSNNNATNNFNGISLYHSNDNIISNNTINSNSRNGIYTSYSNGNTVVNNTANSNPYNNIFLDWSSNSNTVMNNTFTNTTWGIFIGKSSNNNTIANNNVIDNYEPVAALYSYGISAINSNNITIVNNIVTNSDYGIWLRSTNDLRLSNNNTIKNNTVLGNIYGIWLRLSIYNTIVNNTASNNDYGIWLMESSIYNTIVNNTASNNDYGIYVYTSSIYNTIANNIVTNSNIYGIYVYTSSNGNTIYNNYFNNTNNVWDTADNIWNISKTSGPNIIGGAYLGGNYWNDYTGIDTDGDDLGDTEVPYTSSGGIQNGGDYLPLVFSIPDTSPPEITSVMDAPDPQETGGYVNITCEVTDNLLVDEVWVNITYPDSNYLNETMLGGSYYYNATYTMLGTYDYFIWANDTRGNSNTSASFSFDIQDTTSPQITDVDANPNLQRTGGYVNISCNVTDNVGVDEVFLNITYLDSSFENFSISANKTGNNYYCNRSYLNAGAYTYFIWANDTSGNSNTSSSYTFTVIPAGVPFIVDNSADIAGTGGSFVVNATVTDDDGVDGVWVEYWFDGGSRTNESMAQVGVTDYYERTINIPSGSTDDLWYNISANNTFNNWSRLNNQQVVVIDDDLPTITNVQVTPDTVSQGGYVNITCDVDDNVGVDEAWVNITYPDTSIQSFLMSIGSYYCNQSYLSVGNYTYFIWANDTSGNSNTSSSYQFNITTSDAPSIVDNSADDAGAGEYFVVNATVTDDDGVDGVWVEYWFDGGSRTNRSMAQVGVTDYYERTINIPSGSTDDLWYNISANDTYDVWSHLNNQRVVVTYIDSSVDDIFSYNQTSSPLTINATNNNDPVDNVTLYYRYSTDNSSWGDETYTFGVPNSEFMNPTGHNNEYDCVAYSSDRNSIRAYFSPDYNGTAQDITIRYYYGSGSDSIMKCALYYENETFIAETEEKTLPDGIGYGNVTFNFVGDRPEVYSDVTYILAQWFDETGADYTFIYCGGDTDRFNYGDAEDYDNGVFPEPLDDDDHPLWDGWSLAIICHYTTGTSWVEWNDSSNPDTSSPWQWSFDFPNGTGYYEFYSIGKKSGFSDESAPTSADAICYYEEDTTSPEITDVTDYPDPQEAGGYVNISCDVTDNIGVDEVFLNITDPNNNVQNFSITGNKTGDMYYCNRIYTTIGTYNYSIWANDTSGNANTSATYSFVIEDAIVWDVILGFTGPDGVNDSLVFGEATDASDGQDSYDVPKSGTPPSPYIYAWFDANLSEPYNILMRDYRQYPGTFKVWDMYVYVENSNSSNVTISWDPSRLVDSEYSFVTLKDLNSDINTDMLLKSNYTYFASNISVRHFRIICSVTPFEYYYMISLSEGWNLISLPVNQSFHKDNIKINYFGVNHSWQDAVNDSIVLRFIYEWKAATQNYDFTDILNPGGGYWMYAYDDCDLWITSNTSNNDDFITDLSEEWNLIGLPYDTPVAKENLTVYYNGTECTWEQAVNNNTVLEFIYEWKAATQSYDFTDILNPGGGYWMYAYYDCTLLRPTI